MSKSKFIGEAGEHFVAYKLSRLEYYVGLTLGNMPNIDIILSSGLGLKSMSLQVKTSKGAYRKNRYGSEGYEWDVNKGVIGRNSIDFWYCFVDFKWNSESVLMFILYHLSGFQNLYWIVFPELYFFFLKLLPI